MADLYDFAGDQAEIQRRQAIAQMLMQQGNAPIEQSPSGRLVAPIAPTQGIAKMLSAYLGNKQLKDTTAEQAALNKRTNADLADAVAKWQGGDTAGAMSQFANNPNGQPYVQMIARALAKQKQLSDADLVGHYTTDSIARFKATGGKDFSVLQPYEKPLKQEWWQSPEGIAARKEVAAAGKPTTTVTVDTAEKPFWANFGKLQSDEFGKQQTAAQSAADQIKQINDTRKLVDSGIFSGTGADAKLALGKGLKAIGINLADNEIANTEAFTAQMGNQVLAHIKVLGTNPSNTDRDFIEKVVGGKTTLDEATIRKLLDLNEKYSRQVVQKYNSNASKIKSNPNFANMPLDVMVQEPEQYQPATAAATPPAGKQRLKYNPKTGGFE